MPIAPKPRAVISARRIIRRSANGRNASLKTANWIGFFVDNVSGNNIYGRITPITGIYQKGGPAPNAALPKTIRLVQ